MPGPAFLRGETVDLHTIEPEDAEFLQQCVNDPRIRGTIGGIEPYNGPTEREWIEGLGDEDGVRLLVCADGDPVGTVGLEPPNEVWGTTEVGYFVAPDRWGNGYATAAVDLVAGYAFDERRLHRLSAQVYAINPASERVLEKVGFEREGVLREAAFVDGEHVDVHRYGLLAEEWREREG